jgi:hypothetical protein
LPGDTWSSAFVLGAVAAGVSFYGIVMVRLVAARPYGLITLWFLFIAYTIWLGLLPPVDRHEVTDWIAWFGVLAALVVLVSVSSRVAF